MYVWISACLHQETPRHWLSQSMWASPTNQSQSSTVMECLCVYNMSVNRMNAGNVYDLMNSPFRDRKANIVGSIIPDCKSNIHGYNTMKRWDQTTEIRSAVAKHNQMKTSYEITACYVYQGIHLFGEVVICWLRSCVCMWYPQIF